MDQNIFNLNNKIYSNNNNILLEIINDLQKIINNSKDNVIIKILSNVIIKMNNIIDENKKILKLIRNDISKLYDKLSFQINKKFDELNINNKEINFDSGKYILKKDYPEYGQPQEGYAQPPYGQLGGYGKCPPHGYGPFGEYGADFPPQQGYGSGAGYPQKQGYEARAGYPQKQPEYTTGHINQQQQGNRKQQKKIHKAPLPKEGAGTGDLQQSGYPQQSGGFQPIPDSAHEHGLQLEPTNEACKVCHRPIGGKIAYVCHQCPFVLCYECSNEIFYGNKAKQIHPHPLTLKYRSAWKCDLCKQHYRETASFYCKPCDFDACSICYVGF